MAKVVCPDCGGGRLEVVDAAPNQDRLLIACPDCGVGLHLVREPVRKPRKAAARTGGARG